MCEKSSHVTCLILVFCHKRYRVTWRQNLRRQHGSPRSQQVPDPPGYRPRDPGALDLVFHQGCSTALSGFPIERNQRKIVSSPSEAFAPAIKCCWWSHRSVSPPIKFRKFTLYFYSGIHRTGSIIQTLGILIFQNYFSSSSIFGFFWNNSNHSCLVCQHCKFTPSCYRLW